MAQLNIPYDVGAEMWTPSNDSHMLTVQCPECCGNKYVTVTLGSGNVYTLDCACCGHGLDRPRGYVEVRDYTSGPKCVTLGAVTIETWGSGPELRYGGIGVTDLYENEEACRDECTRRNRERKKNDEEQALHRIASKRKELAWSVHYWGRQVAELKRDLERAEARLAVCKERKVKK